MKIRQCESGGIEYDGLPKELAEYMAWITVYQTAQKFQQLIDALPEAMNKATEPREKPRKQKKKIFLEIAARRRLCGLVYPVIPGTHGQQKRK